MLAIQSAKNQKNLSTGLTSKIGLILYLAAVIFYPLQALGAGLVSSSASQVVGKGSSPDGTMIALTEFSSNTGQYNTSLNDVSTGERIFAIEGSAFECFSPDGSLLTRKPDCEETISGSIRRISSPGFTLWNATTGERIREFEGERCPTFSPDGTMLAIGTTNADTHYQDILLYNVSTGEHIRTFEGEYALFSPDGSTIATDIRGHLDNYIEGALWNVATGELIYTFKGQHLDFIPQPEGDLLVLTAWNSHIRKDGLTVWNIKTGELVLTLDNTWNNDSNHDAIMQALQTTDTATPGKKANLRDFTTGEVKRTYREEDRPGFVPKDSFAKYLSDKCKDPVWIIAAGVSVYTLLRICF